jgi:hypothetical protein
MTHEWRPPSLLGRCSCQLRYSHAGANTVYSRVERVFFHENYFSSKSFVAIREEFGDVYPYKEVMNKATHWLVTEFWDTGSVRDGKYIRRPTCWQARRCSCFSVMGLRPILLGVALGHRYLRNLPTPELFLWGFLQSPRSWNTIRNVLLPTLTQKHFAELHKTLERGRMLVLRRWRTDSASAVRLRNN